MVRMGRKHYLAADNDVWLPDSTCPIRFDFNHGSEISAREAGESSLKRSDKTPPGGAEISLTAAQLSRYGIASGPRAKLVLAKHFNYNGNGSKYHRKPISQFSISQYSI